MQKSTINQLKVTVVLFTLMILSKTILAQDSTHIRTSKEVLKYLYQESVRAKYLDKALKINDSIIINQMDMIRTKDSMILNRAEALNQCELDKEIEQIKIQDLEEDIKDLSFKSRLFKFTTILTAGVGTISSIYFWIK